MAISFVASASNTANSGGSSFTIDKPAGVQDNDFLVAIVGVYPGAGGAAITFTAPTGWTKVAQQYSTSRPEFPMSIGIFTRVALAADPASWTGSYNRSVSEPEVSVVAAYRGASQVLAYTTSQTNTTGTLSTGTVNNTLADSWRVTMGAYTSTSLDYNITSNEVSLRKRAGTVDGTPDSVQVGLWDSNAAIATGNTSRTISRSQNWDSACAGIVLLQAGSTEPTTGDMACTVPSVSSPDFGEGEVHDDGVIDSDLPLVSAEFEGEGQPQPADGPVDATVPLASFEGEGGSDIIGSMDATVLPSMSFVGETVPFGIRVIKVEEDDRTITVLSRGVED